MQAVCLCLFELQTLTVGNLIKMLTNPFSYNHRKKKTTNCTLSNTNYKQQILKMSFHTHQSNSQKDICTLR